EACSLAARMRTDDMDLQRELKDLGAQLTMTRGKYTSGGSFRDSVKDFDKQQELMQKDTGVYTSVSMAKAIREAEAELAADPNEAGKVIKLVEALRRTEDLEAENKAISVLEDAQKRTGQFRWRKQIGEIK